MQHFHPKKSTRGTRAWSLRRERYVWEGKGTLTAALRRRSVVWNWLLCCGAYSLCLLPSHLDRQFAHGTRTTSSYTIARLFVGHCVVGYADLLFSGVALPLPRVYPLNASMTDRFLFCRARIHRGRHPSIVCRLLHVCTANL